MPGMIQLSPRGREKGGSSEIRTLTMGIVTLDDKKPGYNTINTGSKEQEGENAISQTYPSSFGTACYTDRL